MQADSSLGHAGCVPYVVLSLSRRLPNHAPLTGTRASMPAAQSLASRRCVCCHLSVRGAAWPAASCRSASACGHRPRLGCCRLRRQSAGPGGPAAAASASSHPCSGAGAFSRPPCRAVFIAVLVGPAPLPALFSSAALPAPGAGLVPPGAFACGARSFARWVRPGRGACGLGLDVAPNRRSLALDRSPEYGRPV